MHTRGRNIWTWYPGNRWSWKREIKTIIIIWWYQMQYTCQTKTEITNYASVCSCVDVRNMHIWCKQLRFANVCWACWVCWVITLVRTRTQRGNKMLHVVYYFLYSMSPVMIGWPFCTVATPATLSALFVYYQDSTRTYSYPTRSSASHRK